MTTNEQLNIAADKIRDLRLALITATDKEAREIGEELIDSLFPDVALEPTPAMKAGTSKLFQCNWCGTLVCIPGTRDDVARKPQGPCPGCTGDHGWSAQSLGTGPFRAAPGEPVAAQWSREGALHE